MSKPEIVNKLEKAAEQYVESINESDNIYSYVFVELFIAGANWQVVATYKVIERAIIKHNHSTQEAALKNFRNICGSLNKGKCAVDGKKCTFNNCEALKDLFKE